LNKFLYAFVAVVSLGATPMAMAAGAAPVHHHGTLARNEHLQAGDRPAYLARNNQVAPDQRPAYLG
jgi:hypothetical protein